MAARVTRHILNKMTVAWVGAHTLVDSANATVRVAAVVRDMAILVSILAIWVFILITYYVCGSSVCYGAKLHV